MFASRLCAERRWGQLPDAVGRYAASVFFIDLPKGSMTDGYKDAEIARLKHFKRERGRKQGQLGFADRVRNRDDCSDQACQLTMRSLPRRRRLNGKSLP